MKIRIRFILRLLLLLAFIYAGFLGLRTYLNSHMCMHEIKKAYPPVGNPYYVESDEEACSGFGATYIITVKLVKSGRLFNTESTLFVFDAADMQSMTVRWKKADELEVMVDPMPYILEAPVAEVDGIKVAYIYGSK